MAIILRAVKGAPLTIAELDGNFTDLDGRVQDIEDGGGSDGPRQIDFIEQVANTLIVHYTDDTEDGPFDLGALNLRFRDAWIASESYLVYDIVTSGGATYMVLFGHTSGLTFDAGANDGLGHDYYGLLLENPSIALPTGGLTDQVLTKLSNDSFDTGWRTPTSVEGGASAVFPITGTIFSPTLGYASTYVRCTHVDGCEIIIPLDSSLDFDVGSEIHFRQCAAGGLVFTGDSDTDDEVTLNTVDGFDAATDTTGAVVTVKKVDVNSWDVWGLLAETSV